MKDKDKVKVTYNLISIDSTEYNKAKKQGNLSIDFNLEFPYSIMTIFAENVKIFELLQNEDGTVISNTNNIDGAARILFDKVLKKAQKYALDYLKHRKNAKFN